MSITGYAVRCREDQGTFGHGAYLKKPKKTRSRLIRHLRFVKVIFNDV